MYIYPKWMLKGLSGNGIDRHGICTRSTFPDNAKCLPNYWSIYPIILNDWQVFFHRSPQQFALSCIFNFWLFGMCKTMFHHSVNKRKWTSFFFSWYLNKYNYTKPYLGYHSIRRSGLVISGLSKNYPVTLNLC